jgi:hypothetical protein
MTAKERAEHARLCRIWARQRATVKQIHRCMQLSRRLENERVPSSSKVNESSSDGSAK